MAQDDDDIHNPVADYQRKVLLERSAQSRIEFAKMNQLLERNVPELIFKTHFLPFFAGDDIPNRAEVLRIWHTIAGANWLPVNIVDSNGKFVIQVPSLHESSYFVPIVKRDSDMNYAMKVANEKSAISPSLANNIVVNELLDRFDTMSEHADGQEIEEKWNKLLAHYGRAKPTSSKASQVHNDDDNEFDYG